MPQTYHKQWRTAFATQGRYQKRSITIDDARTIPVQSETEVELCCHFLIDIVVLLTIGVKKDVQRFPGQALAPL